MKFFVFCIVLLFISSVLLEQSEAKKDRVHRRDLEKQREELFRREDDDDDENGPMGSTISSTASTDTPTETQPQEEIPSRDLHPLPTKKKIYPLASTAVTIFSKTNNVLCEVRITNAPQYWHRTVSVSPITIDRLNNISYPTKQSASDLSHIASTVFNIDIVDDDDNIIPATFTSPVEFSFLITPEDGRIIPIPGKICLAYIHTVTNEWVCEQEFIYSGEEFINGTVTHFTEFAILLVPESNSPDTTKEPFTSNRKMMSIVICSVVAGIAVFSIVVGLLVGLCHRNQRKQEEEDIRVKSEKIAQVFCSPNPTPSSPQTV